MLGTGRNRWMLEMRRLERTSRCGHQGAQESNKDTASVTCPHKANDEETGGNGMMGTQQFREGWHPTWEAETGQQENKLRHPNRKGNRSFPNSQEWMNTAGGFLFTSFRFFCLYFYNLWRVLPLVCKDGPSRRQYKWPTIIDQNIQVADHA